MLAVARRKAVELVENLLECLLVCTDPDGFEGTGEDGGLKICKGSHLFRDWAVSKVGGSPGLEVDDGEFMHRWLAGKSHPITGRPLEVTRLSLPPGSVVAAFAHLAHGVSPRAIGLLPRGASLWCYHRYEPAVSQPWPDGKSGGVNLPPALQSAGERGELPARLSRLIDGVVSSY